VVYRALCIGLFGPFVAKPWDVWGRQKGVTVICDRVVMGIKCVEYTVTNFQLGSSLECIFNHMV
jgi:hypothetical protein